MVREMVKDPEKLNKYAAVLDYEEDYNFGLGEDAEIYNSDDEENLVYSKVENRDTEKPWYLIDRDSKSYYLFKTVLTIATWISLF